MLMLEGVWENAPQEILKNKSSKIESEGILESIYLAT